MAKRRSRSIKPKENAVTPRTKAKSLREIKKEEQAILESIYGTREPPDVGSPVMESQPELALTEDDAPYLEKTVVTLVDPVTNEVSAEATRRLPTVPEILAAHRDGTPQPKVAPIGSRHRVSLRRDHTLTYPDLWLSVYIEGPDWEVANFAKMFVRSGCWKADTPEEADLVVFTGGVDVDPQLYGEEPHPKTETPSPRRDAKDMELYAKCLKDGIPMLGICRGAQFLAVMNGAKLYQHVDNHQGVHSMWDVKNQQHIEKVSSVHHQMVIHHDGMEIIATSAVARNRWRNDKVNDIGNKADIEAFFYRDTCCIGIQGHPEYEGYNYFTKWTLDLLNDLVLLNPDVDWFGPKHQERRRLSPDFIAQRNQQWADAVKQSATTKAKAKTKEKK